MRLQIGTAICCVTVACASGSPRGPEIPPLAPSTAAADRLQHAAIEGALAGTGTPTMRNFFGGLAGGALLGPIGVLIAYSNADADPAFIPISPTPRYADTSFAYVSAFRQAYDRQVQSDRRGAAIGGGVAGTIISTVAVFVIVNNRK